MTDHEKAIVSAYTGVAMLTGEKFSIFHKYIEDICGRPIWTHELANEKVANEIKEKSKPDFIALCKGDGDTIIAKKNEYRRGWHDAIGRALMEAYTIQTEDGCFDVVQKETLIGVGMSINPPDGDMDYDIDERIMNTNKEAKQ